MTPQTVLMTADAVSGVWHYTCDLGGALAARGARVLVAVMGPPPATADRRDAERAGLAVVSRPYRLEWMDDPWVDVRRAGEWLMTLDRLLRPDVIHLNGFVQASLPWSAPVVVVAHSCVRAWWRAVKGVPAPSDLDRYTSAVKAGLEAADAVVTPNAAMRAALESEYGVELGTTIIPNATAARPAGDLSAKDDIVFSAGRAWDEGKNIASLCAAASKVTWPIYVAGDRCRPDGTVCELPDVHALGRLQRDELTGWYERASIYALPARYEPFGLSVLEAATAGCALVLGDIESLREHWDGAAAFVPPDDSEALACAIRGLVSNRGHRILAGARARRRASSFTIDRMADAYVGLYEKLQARTVPRVSPESRAARGANA